MSDIKAVLFDWGGVIADDPGDEFLAQLIKDLGASNQEVKEILGKYMSQLMRGTISSEEYWQLIRDEYGLNVPATISLRFLEWSGLRANPTVLDLIAQLKQREIKVGILSNVIEPTYQVLRDNGYYDVFDEVIASCVVKMTKPDIEIYEYSLEKLKLPAKNVPFIDDKQKNLDPALELGIHAILAGSSEQLIRDTVQFCK